MLRSLLSSLHHEERRIDTHSTMGSSLHISWLLLSSSRMSVVAGEGWYMKTWDVNALLCPFLSGRQELGLVVLQYCADLWLKGIVWRRIVHFVLDGC